ncbi:Competence/damage-inducible protein CinA [Richelia intracellularis HH01]|uniref:CinA-like protein n=1 Tax=Richelia intracellularis HH01 TaxID=1165094 RepID=M1X2M4_9NOST|nr:competence/damage-inducible protein A [Richelia intracellularis]CCH67080.1 Competence/damage-inducible protein CinA [Richelia intracellularis HH01]HAE05609.1 competence/damage-inducible protein A [Richelia sp.]
MSAEIICIGTELLLGDIVNGNAQYLAKQLARLGIPHYYQTVVGDNIERIKQAIAIGTSRSQILIFTGGLGPTPDDLTCEAIASFFDTTLEERQEIIEDLQRKYSARGRVMASSNRKQALMPQGAEILYNPTGTAPGIIWQPRSGITILTFPGVTSEMHRMWEETAVPYLQNQGWGKTVIYSRMLKFWGVAESTLAEKVNPYLNLSNPTVATYAGKGEVKLRVSAKAENSELAEALINPVTQKIQNIAGLDYYGADKDTLASVIGVLLYQRGETLAVAESCTGGLVGKMLTDISGSSDYFWGSITAYDNRVKQELLGVTSQDLETLGAVSAVVAEKMSAGVRLRLGTTWGLSVTGIAGPSGESNNKPIGLVYIGLASSQGTISFENHFGASRDRTSIRHLSACTALDILRRELITTKY